MTKAGAHRTPALDQICFSDLRVSRTALAQCRHVRRRRRDGVPHPVGIVCAVHSGTRSVFIRPSLVFVTLLCEMAVHIAITNHRVVWVRDKVILDEHTTEYAFTIMETVEARKHGLLQTILRYGTLQFETGPDITLVPHPISVAKDIEQAMGNAVTGFTV